MLVLCGSVTSWIQDNILNQTGFVGRCSWQFRLPPLALPACNLFWRGKPVSAAEKLKILSVTGGVPRYLEEIDPAQTAEQNIRRLCFHAGGMLFREFDQRTCFCRARRLNRSEGMDALMSVWMRAPIPLHLCPFAPLR
ncbi:MAG: hypothetical protein C5B50_18040 [Verrucomicrobia bacterium]|nr:MAG: hypothetical protein C5B50_18040 [Verrucomicrobiota bacterium]